jgi:hypothetical protein
VEEDVAGGGDGVATSGANLLKGVKLSGTRGSEEFVPSIRAEPSYAGKASFHVAELDGAHEAGEIGAEGPYGGVGVVVLTNAEDEEDGGACQWADYELRENNLVEFLGDIHSWLV